MVAISSEEMGKFADTYVAESLGIGADINCALASRLGLAHL
jgi:hypothetical protein